MNRAVTLLIFFIISLIGNLNKASASDTLYHSRDSVLYISAELKTIPPFAFADRKDIREIRFESESKCTEIGEYAFLGCSSLRVINLPECLRTLDTGVFRECSSLSEIALPAGITVIPGQCFSWCTALETVHTEGQIKDIKQFAFIYCESLSDFNFGDRLTHIGNNAFSRCESLTGISLPSSVIELESYAFSDCFSLKKAVLPANSEMLGELIFSGCQNLTEIVEDSPEPPAFDCNSFIFEPDDAAAYKRCKLIIPRSSEKAYRSSPGWELFFHQ